MPASFEQKLLAASAFLIFSSIGACLVGAANASSASVGSAQIAVTDVDRAHKSDPLMAAPIQHLQQKPAPAADGLNTSLKRPPLGCDGAFSPVADPTRAGIYKRCTV